MAIEFSQFAQALYPCSGVSSQEKFVILLTDNIMCGQPGRSHKNPIRGGRTLIEDRQKEYQNPLRGKSDEDTTLEAIYRGSRPIPGLAARILYGSRDSYKFEKFLRRQYSEEALEAIKDELLTKGGIPKTESRDPAEICTDLFVEILHDLATKK